MSLIKSLPKIAARELRNTHCGLRNLKFKLELIATAYGIAMVEADFTVWCREHTEDRFKYPIFEYMKVIDSRLGGAPEEKQANLEDPQIVELKSLAYELTRMLPFSKAVATALVKYPAEEIKTALIEYTDELPDKDVKAYMHAFWSEGGAEAIILARRRRNADGH